MADLTKLASYLDSFKPGDEDYDQACFIKQKIASAQMEHDVNEEIQDQEVTAPAEEDKSNSNIEGQMLHSAFEDLDVLNAYEKEKEQVNSADQNTKSPVHLESSKAIQVTKSENMFDRIRKRLAK